MTTANTDVVISVLDVGVVNNVVYYYTKTCTTSANIWLPIDKIGNAGRKIVKSFIADQFGSDHKEFFCLSEAKMDNSKLDVNNNEGVKYLDRLKKTDQFRKRLLYLTSDPEPKPDGTHKWHCDKYPELSIINQLRSQYIEWQQYINKCIPEGIAELQVEPPDPPFASPPQITFISDNIYSIVLPQAIQSAGCSCEDCSKSGSKCCPSMVVNLKGRADLPYKYGGLSTMGFVDRRLNALVGQRIIECGQNCHCGHDCLNRVVQYGRKVPLQLFYTGIGRGWGVRTSDPIRKGMFVTEYLGEIITSNEADIRGNERLSDYTYIFDLDFLGHTNRYCIDATNFGNEARFINHNCDPNLVLFNVYTDKVNIDLPRIAFFAKRQINIGDELTIDYEDAGGLRVYEKEKIDPNATLKHILIRDSFDEMFHRNESNGANVEPSQTEEEHDFTDSDSENISQGTAPRRQSREMKCLCGSTKCRGTIFKKSNGNIFSQSQ